MSTLQLLLRDDLTRFRPGEVIHGAAGWNLERQPSSVEARLFWFTRGKGTTDRSMIAAERFNQPQLEDSRTFQFRLPDEAFPYSFSGKLLSIIWAVELVVNDKESQAVEITVSPTGQEIVPSGTSETSRPI